MLFCRAGTYTQQGGHVHTKVEVEKQLALLGETRPDVLGSDLLAQNSRSEDHRQNREPQSSARL
jgi:hypothetical protein